MNTSRLCMIALLITSSSSLLWISCAEEQEEIFLEEVTPLEPSPPSGKTDDLTLPGLPVSVDTEPTAVWTVLNQWEDTDTSEARKAGMAWPADSGLSWDEKFSRWIVSLKKVPSLEADNSFVTLELSTPWGTKVLPAPRLDCADVWIFLRASFAAWYRLPFVLEGRDGKTRVFFGHFGIRTDKGPWGKSPLFATAYADYSDLANTPELLLVNWPSDPKLRKLGISFYDDQQFFLGNNARSGAYLDEIHLNKRAAYFIRLLLMYFGTQTLSDGRNAYNLVPQAIREGDALLYRNATNGAGHTMVIMRALRSASGKISAEIAAGNIPPQQPAWESAASSKAAFLFEEAGSLARNAYGELYAHAGGGLKRFRVTKAINGIWTNTFMQSDQTSWINSTDYQRIGERLKTFEEILEEASPEEKLQALIKTIDDSRRHIRNHPASCSARTRREKAFKDLYALDQQLFNMSPKETDKKYRMIEDYVFAELVYEKSKTCCWNKTTPQMFNLIMEYAKSLEQLSSQCASPPVFMATNGGFDTFLTYAISVGKGDEWKAWTEDENCPQREAIDDLETAQVWTPYCDLR